MYRLFEKTGKKMDNHLHEKSEELGFYHILNMTGKTVIFKTIEGGICFTAYGCIVKEVK